MAQVTSSHPRQDFSVFAKNEAVTVAQTGNTALIEVDTSCIETLAVEAVVTGDLDQEPWRACERRVNRVAFCR